MQPQGQYLQVFGKHLLTPVSVSKYLLERSFFCGLKVGKDRK